MNNIRLSHIHIAEGKDPLLFGKDPQKPRTVYQFDDQSKTWVKVPKPKKGKEVKVQAK